MLNICSIIPAKPIDSEQQEMRNPLRHGNEKLRLCNYDIMEQKYIIIACI